MYGVSNTPNFTRLYIFFHENYNERVHDLFTIDNNDNDNNDTNKNW